MLIHRTHKWLSSNIKRQSSWS